MRNKTCHNYCEPKSSVPAGVTPFLGLGLKFCIKTPRPTNKLNKTFERFNNDVRRIHYFKTHPPEEEDEGEVTYIPELYIKSDWEPPKCADASIEKSMADFETTLCREQQLYNKPTLSNLTPRQWRMAELLKDNDKFITIEGDKNLGGCILIRDTYNHRACTEHLGDRTIYQPLSKEEARRRLGKLRYNIRSFYSKWRAKRIMSKAEVVYLQRALEENPEQHARFRMSLKVHKTPWKMRPIVCCAGTFMNHLSRWLDYWLQKLKPFIPTYLRDSKHILTLLAELGPLPPNAKLFTADANSMYTNIDTDHAIEVINAWLDSLDLPQGYPLEAVKEAMEMVMRNNIFEWGNMLFLQLLGTAMGTSAACMWATIYFAVHESGLLIPKYNNQLLLFRRFIDDIFGIWIGNDNASWEEFKSDTNNFGILTWEFEELSQSVNFLDLTITIESNKIITKTYQKALNLYQYLGPQSAHPPKMIKGVIYSLLKTYHQQNSRESDYNAIVAKTFNRYCNRGWNRAILKGYILDADQRVKSTVPKVPPPAAPPSETPLPNNKETLYIHMEYHPNDIPRHRVRAIFNHYCQELFKDRLDITQSIVAYSRPPNIKDTVTKAKLHQAPGRNASKFYSGELP